MKDKNHVIISTDTNGEKMKIFSLGLGTKQRCPFLLLLFNITLGYGIKKK